MQVQILLYSTSLSLCTLTVVPRRRSYLKFKLTSKHKTGLYTDIFETAPGVLDQMFKYIEHTVFKTSGYNVEQENGHSGF